MIDGEPRPMHVRQRQRLEQGQLVGGEDCDGTRPREMVRLFEVIEHLPQRCRDRFAVLVRQGLPRELRFTLAHAVLHLDEVFAARAVARLELQITADHPVSAWLDRRQARDEGLGVLLGNCGW